MTEPKPTYLGNVTSEQVVLARDYEALAKKAQWRLDALMKIANIVGEWEVENIGSKEALQGIETEIFRTWAKESKP
jgi:hypothetical protein